MAVKLIESTDLQELERSINGWAQKFPYRFQVVGYANPEPGTYSALVQFSGELMGLNDRGEIDNQNLSPAEVVGYDRNNLAGFIESHGIGKVSDQFELTPEEKKMYLPD